MERYQDKNQELWKMKTLKPIKSQRLLKFIIFSLTCNWYFHAESKEGNSTTKIIKAKWCNYKQFLQHIIMSARRMLLPLTTTTWQEEIKSFWSTCWLIRLVDSRMIESFLTFLDDSTYQTINDTEKVNSDQNEWRSLENLILKT